MATVRQFCTVEDSWEGLWRHGEEYNTTSLDRDPVRWGDAGMASSKQQASNQPYGKAEGGGSCHGQDIRSLV